MKLIKWSYKKRNNIKAQFDVFPYSLVLFRKIKNYYFVYTVQWSDKDPVITKTELEEMEIILNQEIGADKEYQQRKQYKK